MSKITYPTHPCQRKSQAIPDGVIALTINTFAQGTAGAYYPELFNLENLDFRGPIPVETCEKHGEETYALSTAQLLSKIRDIFGLRMSEVAQIFGVSRRAAYDWLEGATPRPDTVARIYTLSRYAEELRTAGLIHVERYMHRPVISGRSLLELLKSGDSVETAIAVIKRTAAEEAKNRKQLGSRTSDTNTASINGFDEVSTPISE